MTWCEYLTFAYLLTGAVLAAYYTVHDIRARCFPDHAILLIPLMPLGWPYTVWVLARAARQRYKRSLAYEHRTKQRKRKGKK